MLFMMIERFRDSAAVYQRLAERGRMLPDGVSYLDSWVEPNRQRCFQLMNADSISSLQEWAKNWSDLVDFEFIEVTTSREAAAGAGTPTTDLAAVVLDTLKAAFIGNLNVLDAHPGMASLKNAWPKVMRGLPDITAELKQVLVDGDRVATHWIFRGAHTGELFGIPPSGKPVQYQNVSISRVEDGRIVQYNSEAGWLAVLMQIGELPRKGA